ncbi:MAG: hypothetical protein R2724_14550 [Bryobacterales bacterium]
MVVGFAKRMLTEPDPRALRKFVWNFGVKGMRSVQTFKKRIKQGEHFPPFLFISIISGCQLRCQGCWVDVAAESKKIELEDLDRIVTDAKSAATATSASWAASRSCIRNSSTCSNATRTATSRSSPTGT